MKRRFFFAQTILNDYIHCLVRNISAPNPKHAQKYFLIKISKNQTF